jgi:hypothetical protein
MSDTVSMPMSEPVRGLEEQHVRMGDRYFARPCRRQQASRRSPMRMNLYGSARPHYKLVFQAELWTTSLNRRSYPNEPANI